MFSLVSNATFALVSLSLSKLIKFGFEMGMFSYFLDCFVVQLFTINWKLILVALLFGCPLFFIHSSWDSQPEVGNEGQAIHSSSDSEPEVDSAQVVHSPSNSEPDVGNGGQVIHSYSDSQAETSSECQVVHSSLDPRPEVGGCSQHVINIHT
ncbi:putative transmembrane protein [Sesbania bispinosa]|nr:putative transmembrane protein [Sesbania bispinosa]